MIKFNGMYYKHQTSTHTISLIAGTTKGHAFIQVITNTNSFYFRYPLPILKCCDSFKIGDNFFSKDGIKIHIAEPDIFIYGEIKYTELTSIKYDIMGPFKYFPMQCRHKILSLHHKLEGSLTICSKTIDFTGGVGYVEGDCGISFPKSYVWVQSNDFHTKACITASVADIPFAGFHFKGCICIVYLDGIEYRMATYLGVKILCCNENLIILKQGNLYLEIEIDSGKGYKLMAPEKGKMTREICERITCGMRFKFVKDGDVLFDKYSKNASFEYCE